MPLLLFLHLNHKYTEASILLQAGNSRQALVHVLHLLSLSAFMHYGGSMMSHMLVIIHSCIVDTSRKQINQ